MKKLVIIGAGGHAHVIADIAIKLAKNDPNLELAGFVDDAANFGPEIRLALPIVGADDCLSDLYAAGSATHFIIGIGATRGGQGLRGKLFSKMQNIGLKPLSLVAPSAIVSDMADIGLGVAIMAGAIVNSRASIGDNAIVNTGAIIEHDVVMEAGAHAAPGAVIAGGCIIGETAMVGAGATLKQGLTIGAGATVGAGSTIVKDVEKNKVVFGPAGK